MILTPEKKALQNKRRNDVLRLAMHGLTHEEIAEGLGVTPLTVARDLKVNRNTIIKNVKNIESVIAECAAAKQEIIRELWKKYQQTGEAKILPDIWGIHRDFVKVLRPDLYIQQNNIIKTDNVIILKWDDGTDNTQKPP